MLLQLLDLGEALGLGDEGGHLVVRASLLGLLVADLEDILQALEGDRDDLGIVDGKEVAKGADAALLDEELDLGCIATGGGVADGPGSLLADIELSIGKELDERWDDVVVDNGLDLVLVAGGDVGDGPACLLANTLLGGGEEGEEAGEGIVVDDELCLEVITRHDVANGTEGRSLDSRRRVEQELDEAAADASLDDGLDLLVGAVRKIRQGPACVGEDLLVGTEDELCEGGQTGLDHIEVGLGLATAEVGQGPGGIAKHGQFGVLVKLLKEGLHGPGLKDEVTAGRAVTGDVAEGPNGLFPNVVVGRHEKTDEDGDSTDLNDDLGMIGRAGCNVGKGPGGLELKRRAVVPLEELDEAGDDAGINDLLDGRVLLDGKQPAELRGTLGLDGGIVAHHTGDHLGEVLQLVGAGHAHGS